MDKNSGSIKHFLLVFDHQKGELIHEENFGTHGQRALDAYQLMEMKHRHDLLIDIVLTLTHLLPGRLTLGGVLALLLQMSNYYNIFFGSLTQPAGTGALWSLAVEEHFYLVFPVACIILCRNVARPSARGIILLSICAVIFLWRCVLVYKFHTQAERTYYATDTRFDSILFGCALALWGNPILDKSGPSERASKYLWLPLGITMLLCSFIIRDPGFRETARYTIQGVALVPIFIAAIRYPTWWPMRILNLRPIRFMGLISYTLYLVHFTILLAPIPHLPEIPSLVRAALALALAILVATAMYYWVEKPCATLRRRLSA